MRIAKIIALLGALPIAVASAAEFAPEQSVEINTRYLSPPQLVPQEGRTIAEQADDVMRLTGKGAQGSAFTWPLRYAVQVRSYPIIDIEYRAQNVFPHPTTGNTLLQMTMLNPAGQITPAIIVETSELIQDGATHRLRKDLGRFAADNAITEISFTFSAPVSGGTLDLVGLRFEQGPTSPAPFLLPRENVEFVVTDANGMAVADAEVSAGLIERSNWTTVGRTDWQGRVTLPVVRPVRPDGTFVDPVEAMVNKPGYVPQYVAPIEFPRTGPMAVKITAAPLGQLPPIGEEPDGTYYYVPTRETIYYESYPSTIYVDAWAYPWWIPPYFCGYRPYYRGDLFYYYHRPGYRYDWDRHADWRRNDWPRDWHRGDWDRSGWHRPDYSPVPTPRDTARRDYRRDVLRGNDPGGSLEHSEQWRRAVTNPPPPPARVNHGPSPMPSADRGDRYRRVDSTPAPAPMTPAPAPERNRRIETPAPAPTPDRGDRYRRVEPGPTPAPAPTPTPDRRREPDNVRRSPQAPAPVPAPSPAPSDRGDRERKIDGPPVIRTEPRPTPPAAAPAPDRGRRDDDVRRTDPPAAAPGGDRGDRYRRDRSQPESVKPVESDPPRRVAPPAAAQQPSSPPPRRIETPASEARREAPAPRPTPAPEVRREAPAPRPTPAPEVRREAPAPRPTPAPEVRREAPAPRPTPAPEARREPPAPRSEPDARRVNDRADAYSPGDGGPGSSGGRPGRGR